MGNKYCCNKEEEMSEKGYTKIKNKKNLGGKECKCDKGDISRDTKITIEMLFMKIFSALIDMTFPCTNF